MMRFPVRSIAVLVVVLSAGPVFSAGVLTPEATDGGGLQPLYDYHSGLYVQDDFITGSTTSGTAGALGWGTGGTITAITATAATPGQIQLDTGAVSATVARLNGFGSFPVWMANTIDLTWIFKVGTNDANTTIRAGLTNNWAGNPATDGIYLNNAAVATHSTNIPAVAGGPGVMIVNSAAAAKTMIVDYFEMAITGLSR